MKIQVGKAAVKLNGKILKEGVHHVLDKLAYTQKFKQMVQAGYVTLAPRDANQQAALHAKNFNAAQAAQLSGFTAAPVQHAEAKTKKAK